MRAQRQLWMAEGMRKRAFVDGVVDALNPISAGKRMGQNFWDMGTAMTEGRIGSGLWAGAKGLVEGAGIIPGVGLLGKGVGWAGKGIGWAGKALKGAPGTTGLVRKTTGATLSGSGRLTGGLGQRADQFGDAFSKRLPGGNLGLFGAHLGIGAGEAGYGAAASKFNQWTAPKATAPTADYLGMSRGHLQPAFDPMNAGFNPNFGM